MQKLSFKSVEYNFGVLGPVVRSVVSGYHILAGQAGDGRWTPKILSRVNRPEDRSCHEIAGYRGHYGGGGGGGGGGPCKQIGINSGDQAGMLLMCGHSVNRHGGGPSLALQPVSERHQGCFFS